MRVAERKFETKYFISGEFFEEIVSDILLSSAVSVKAFQLKNYYFIITEYFKEPQYVVVHYWSNIDLIIYCDILDVVFQRKSALVRGNRESCLIFDCAVSFRRVVVEQCFIWL